MTGIDQDDRLRVLREHAREWAGQLRPHAFELERDPDTVYRHLDLPAVDYVGKMLIPPRMQPYPLRIGRYEYYGTTAVERVVAAEEIASGDAGMFLASPGASLSGVLVGMLGDEAQQQWYFGRVRERPTWTFFALTEPARGSDAMAMSTTLRRASDGSLTLHGEKRYVGNATRAQVGTVFARTGPGPLGVVAVLVETDAPGYHAEPLDTIGLRGAQISAIRFDDVPVDPGRVLGAHLPASARGMWSALRTFNLLRPGVAAIALGIARAAIEYARSQGFRVRHRDELDRLGHRVHTTRQLILRAAHEVDRDPRNGYLASAAKAQAAQLAEEATLQSLRILGPGARFEHPWLDKLARDARGVEFMEGTRNVQRLNVCHALTKGRFDDD
ncbi:acyl-CoA dehydrogenase family protein [Micromonospora sp. LOL_024]|uniref:acyl-CoA dehydrogenase family protein n=1 Tax=Micromonospora sp. LOL_024 TaxID=3345412 RepID=UPI003A8A62A5